MERTERLLDLVALLLGAGDLVSFADLREAFPDDYGGTQEAAQRKLERDKADLLQLGVPIEYVEASEDRDLGGYRVDRKAYFLQDPRLVPEETAALYAAGAAALAARDFPFAVDLAHALRKIVAGDPKAPMPGSAQAGARHLLVVRPGDPSRAGKLRVLGDAVARRKRVHVVYKASPPMGARPPGDGAGERSERDVDPYGLAFRAGAWRLVGFCHLRQALRVFVVDRIESLDLNETRPNQPDFEVPAGFDAGQVAGTRPWHWVGSTPTHVTLRFAPGAELHAERSFDAPATLLPEGGGRLELEVTWMEGLLPQLLALGDRVWIEGPEAARAQAQATLESLASLLAADPPPREPDPVAPVVPPSAPPPAAERPASDPPRRTRTRPPPAETAVPADKRERLRRLLLIVPAARRRPGVKVDELARELGLDASDLKADIGFLQLVGRPPFSPDDYIDISIDEQNRVTVALDQSFSRPPQLTAIEALALSAAAEEAASADPVIASAIAKLTASLSLPARQLYAALAQRVAAAAPPPAGTSPLIAALRSAAGARREVVLEYDKEGRGAVEERPLQPWAVVDHGGRWYVVGHDLKRGAMRTFRVDRLRAVRPGESTFPEPPPLDPRLFERDEMFFPAGDERAVLLRFSPGAAGWAVSRWGPKARTLASGGVEIPLESAGNAYAVALVLSFAGEAEIVEPPEARAALRDEVARALSRYK